MKILSPAGDMQSLIVAVNNGADEVYLGINEFNARNNVDGFTVSTLKNAVDYAHLRKVKVLLAINILFSDDELQQALDTVVEAYNLGVDAFIIQDLGLAKLICDDYPKIELHASTQMGLHNLEGVEQVKKYGFKRVVLARETPLSEIKRIKDNCDVEIEYFIQGALCVSFSGNCYLSSYILNASGNRGRCKQLCRLPYSFVNNGKTVKKGYLLSAKDFNMSKRLKDLEKVGVDVLKIEGRARRPFYVGMVTKEYRRALDGLEVRQDNIKLAFNRNYTEGYFNGNGDIISNIHNHIGIFIGKVITVKNGKTFNEVFITSNRTLFPKSAFKFFDGETERCTLSAHDLKLTDKGVYRLTTTQRVVAGDSVHLIVDSELENKLVENINRVNVPINITATPNLPIKAELLLDGKKIEVFGETCLPAKNSPVTKEEIQNCFAKSEDFAPIFGKINLENVFLTKSMLNEFRRNTYAVAYERLTDNERERLEKIRVDTNKRIRPLTEYSYAFEVNDEINAKNAVYSPEVYEFDKVLEFKKKCDNLGVRAYLDLPNFALENDIALLKEIVEKTGIGIVANNYYALGFAADKIVGAGLNVYNSLTAAALGYPFMVAEGNLAKAYKFPYMTLRHCPIKTHFGGNCKACRYDDSFAYKMDNGKTLRLKRKKLSSCTFYLTD